MTTVVTVTCKGPDRMRIRYYNEAREFKHEITDLEVGQSIDIPIWDDHLPVMWPLGHSINPKGNSPPKLKATPPATY